MKAHLLWTLSAVALDSVISLVGAVTLALRPDTLRKILGTLTSFGAGSMLGAAFFDLLPEAFRKTGKSPEWICANTLLGLVAFVVIERFLCWSHADAPQEGSRSTLGPLVLISLGLHNFLDGVLIAASFSAGIHLGLITTAAILCHEIPKELGDFAVLVHSGYTPRKALLYNFLSALASVAGALATLVLSSSITGFVPLMIPFTVGGFLFIGCRLLFELSEHQGRKGAILQVLSFGLGVGVMAALVSLLGTV